MPASTVKHDNQAESVRGGMGAQHRVRRTTRARAYDSSRHVFDAVIAATRALFNGLWLGLLDRDDFHAADEEHYDRLRMYRDDAHNLSGLRPWESRAIDAHFTSCRHVIVTSAGGGREVVALMRRGIRVYAFECHPGLAQAGNELFEREGLDAHIDLAPRDECPRAMPDTDGIIVGWGSYMLIPHSSRRIAFLRQLRQRVRPGAPMLLSFFERGESNRYERLTHRVANAIRAVRRKERIEPGDDLMPKYVHRFTQPEIARELAAAGFTLVSYSSDGYPHAVAHAANEPGTSRA